MVSERAGMRRRLASIAVVSGFVALGIVGCTPAGDLPKFPGLYNVTRDAAVLSIKWVVGQAEGELIQESHGGEIEPIDPHHAATMFFHMMMALADDPNDFRMTPPPSAEDAAKLVTHVMLHGLAKR